MNFNEDNEDNEENNNNLLSNNIDEIKLLKKLDDKLEKNKIKNSLNLPSDDIDLDLDFNFDFNILNNNPITDNKNNNNIINDLTTNANKNINKEKENNNENEIINDEYINGLDNNIIFKQIKVNNNQNLKIPNHNENINSPINDITNDKLQKQDINNINPSLNSINGRPNNQLIGSSINLNNNQNNNDDENEEFDFDIDVNEIANVQKEEMEKNKKIKQNDENEIIDSNGNEKEEEERIKREEEERIKREEEERKKKEKEDIIKREEEERIKKEEEEKIKREEEEKMKKEEEEERMKKEEEERMKKEEEERIKREEEERIKREEEERMKKEEEERMKKEEEERIKREEEEKIKREEDEGKKKDDEEIIKVEDEERIKKDEEKDKLKEEKINNDKLLKSKGGKNEESEKKLFRNSINKNSKLFLSLSEDQKKYMLKVLEDIKKFKSKQTNYIDNTDQYPTITIDEYQKENTLRDLIQNFRNIIEKENKEEIEKRKNYFINQIYFEGKIGTNPLLDYIPECEINHVNLIEQIYKEQGLKNIPKIDDDYENNIFSAEKLITSEYYSPIGRLENLKGFIYKYNYEENSRLIINSLKAFDYWRSIQADGNSFFRTFMFSIIEYNILYNNKIKLEQLFSEISCDNFIEIYKEYNLDYKIPFTILGVILQLLSKNEVEKAYDFFIKSYLLKDGSFDKMLIIYLRNISFLFVSEIIEISKRESFQDETDEKDLINTINENLIKTMNVEPNFFIICLMPYLFDINVNLFWIDRDLIQSKDGIINFIDEENGENLPSISIGYFYSSYHKIYSNTFIQEIENINLLFQTKVNNLTKLTFQIKNPKKCEICKNDSFIIFLKQKFKICKNCLGKYINKICSFRNDALVKENYIGQEYYSRAFNIRDEYILNDYEFIEIKEEINIINYIQHMASIFCSECKGNFNRKNLNNLKCKCLLCDKCLEDMILHVTNGLKILNSYEKRNLVNVTCSSCGNHFSYDDAIEHLKDIKEKDKQNAINRMSNYVNTLCLICGDLVRQKDKIKESYLSETEKEDVEEEEETITNKNKDNYKTIKNYKKIRVRKENEIGKGINYLDIEHVICINCYENSKANTFSHTNTISSEMSEISNKGGKKDKKSNKNDKKEKKDKNKKDMNLNDKKDKNNFKDKYYIDFEEGECFCFICNKKHFLIDKKLKNGACCTSGCIIH